MISFPTHSVAPSVYTAFVNGVKFDICEVDEACYEMLNDKRYRFFLCVEDNYIVDFAAAKKFCDTTKEDRWDLLCKSMSDCKSLISKFEDAYKRIIKLEDRARKSKSLNISCTKRVQQIKKSCINTFGTYPTY